MRNKRKMSPRFIENIRRKDLFKHFIPIKSRIK